MTQIATVKRLLGENKAEVMVRRQSACGHDCASCGGCGPDAATQVTVIANNELGAGLGDTVQVESETKQVLGMAFVVYLVPLLFLFVGYFISSGLLELEEGLSLLIGLVCFVIGGALNFLVERRLQKKKAVQFRITEVLKPCSDM